VGVSVFRGIDRVDYHGANGELKIVFSPTGAKLLAAEVTP
jgi:hypothetical protein